MAINEKYLKLSGKVPVNVSWSLDLGKELVFIISDGGSSVEFDTEVVKSEHLDNQDGTYDVIFVLKPRI